MFIIYPEPENIRQFIVFNEEDFDERLPMIDSLNYVNKKDLKRFLNKYGMNELDEKFIQISKNATRVFHYKKARGNQTKTYFFKAEIDGSDLMIENLDVIKTINNVEGEFIQ